MDTAKPTKFTEKYKWEYWKPVFLSILISIPGINGVSLKYICRDQDKLSVITGSEFL